MSTYDHKSSKELVTQYEEAAIQHGESTESGNYKKTNRAHEIVAGVYRELRRRGQEDQELLLALLSSENLAVRVWAATHSLEFRPKRGEPILEAVVAGPLSLVQLDAEMVLKEWRKGNLKFP